MIPLSVLRSECVSIDYHSRRASRGHAGGSRPRKLSLGQYRHSMGMGPHAGIDRPALSKFVEKNISHKKEA